MIALTRPSPVSRSSTAVQCSSTTTCSAAAYSIPSHAHYACNKARGVCTWSCDKGYAVLGDECAQTCATSPICKNEVPVNAIRYPRAASAPGVRCMSGLFNTGTARVKASTLTATSNASLGRSCSVNDGLGCAVRHLDPASYGAGFNAAGRGVFAVLFAETGISIWRSQRAGIPTDILAGSRRWAQWGAPVAARDGSTCDTRTYFKKQELTFDIITCGDWAGSTSDWTNVNSSGAVAARYPTCADAVRDPAAFVEAYFENNYLKVYSV